MGIKTLEALDRCADRVLELSVQRDALLEAIDKAYDLIGNDTDNIGAVLDAWVILGDARRAAVLVPAQEDE